MTEAPELVKIFADTPADRVYLAKEPGTALLVADRFGGPPIAFEDPKRDNRAYFNIRNGHRVVKNLKKLADPMGQYALPDWVDQWESESKWASHRRWADSSERICWTVDGIFIVQGPFSLSLSREIGEIPGSFFSRMSGGWVIPIEEDEQAEVLQKINEEYGVLESRLASLELNGLSEAARELRKNKQAALDEGFRLPTMFPTNEKLEKWQEDAALAMMNRRRELLADQPGLGKTASFINCALGITEYTVRTLLGIDPDDPIPYEDDEVQEIVKSCGPFVIVVPKSLVQNTVNEVLMWNQDAEVAVVHKQKPAHLGEGIDFIVCSETLVGHRYADIIEQEPKGLIADECHMFKTPDTIRTKGARHISDYINYGDWEGPIEGEDTSLIICASGTPIQNRPDELWSILEILGVDELFGEAAYDFLGTDFFEVPVKQRGREKWIERQMTYREAFQKRWCGGFFMEVPFKGGHRGKAWTAFGASHKDELNRMLVQNVMIRRRKRDIMDVPPPYERIVPITLEGEDWSEYVRIRDEFRDYMTELAERMAEEWGMTVPQALNQMNSKLNMAEHFMRMGKLTKYVSEAKAPHVVEWIHNFMSDEGPGATDPTRRKLIVFAHYLDTQRAILDDESLEEYGIATIVAGQKDIQKNVERFQTDPDIRLIICYSGAREGHTLTAAKDVLIADPPPVPAWTEQMAGRCYARMSRDFPPHEAYIHYAVALRTVDALQIRRMSLKKGISDEVIDGEGLIPIGSAKEKEATTAKEREAEANLLVELVLQGDETARVAVS